MSTTEELKNMVLQFKVSDLQSLLGFAGQNKNGRKTELQKKALNLIQCRRSVPLEMKVRNIYRAIVAENAVNNENNRDDYFRSSFDKYSNHYQYDGYTSQSVPNGAYNNNYNPRNNYFPDSADPYCNMWSGMNNGYSSAANFRTTSANNKFDYASYLEPNTKIPGADELRNIVFKKLSFFKYKSCIFGLTPLVPRSQHSELFEFALPFNLNQQEHSLINWAKKSGKESRYQVQLRICLLDRNVVDSSRPLEIGDSLPLALAVKVNDKSCQLPPAIPSTNKQGMLLKRMNAPINLTPQTRRNHANNLLINWSTECNQVYGFTIHLVEKYTADELIGAMVAKGERDPAVTKKYLNEKLNELGDDEIAATSLKVSLLCPLGKILMTLPVRATSCNHLQCFDGSLYVKMNEVKSTWQCPVCNKACFYEDLFVDGYFAGILREGNLGSDVNEIQIEADGTVVPIVPNKKRNHSSPDTAAAAAAAAAAGNARKRVKVKEEPRKEDANSIVVKKKRDSSAEEDRGSGSPVPESSRRPFVETSLPPFIPLFNNACSLFSEERNISATATATATNRAAVVPVRQTAVSNGAGEPSSSSNAVDGDDQAKKNVVLVDLTETDSESEDCSPPGCSEVNLEPASPFSVFSETSNKQSPPIFDIDDSDPS